MKICNSSDLLVFCERPWDFLYERPQHILSRYGKYRRVFYFESPIYGITASPRIHIKETAQNVLVVVPYLPTKVALTTLHEILTKLVDELIYEEDIIDFTIWYYSPEALEFSRHLEPNLTIFDYIDEFCKMNSDLEQELLEKAQLVLTERNKNIIHKNIHHIPNGVDNHHFSQARNKLVEPDDQIHIPRPRIGFYGVIDNRIDMTLLSALAKSRPQYQFVMSGPIINLDQDMLPNAANIHFLEKKDYYALPLYLAGWACTMIPYRRNESNNVLEFLAAGRPVVSSNMEEPMKLCSIPGLVQIADSIEDFGKLLDKTIDEGIPSHWLDQVDHYLEGNDWDDTFLKITELELALISEIDDGHIPLRPLEFNRLNL